jgi:hypothetical protein
LTNQSAETQGALQTKVRRTFLENFLRERDSHWREASFSASFAASIASSSADISRVISPEVRQSGKVNLRLDKFIHSITAHYANPVGAKS